MNLIRPIIYFDLETTGVDTEKDRIVEIACIKYNPDGTQESKEMIINPGIPIPKEASDVHGITDEVVKDKPVFKQLANNMRKWFYGCDLAGFNSDAFDVLLLSAEFERAGVGGIDWNPNLLDIFKLYRKLFPNTLTDVYKRLTGKDLEGAHQAQSDILASKEIADILLPMLREKEDYAFETVESIDDYLQEGKKRVDLAGKLYKDESGDIKYNFGKSKDKKVTEDIGFGEWMLKQSFPEQTKQIIRNLIYGTK